MVTQADIARKIAVFQITDDIERRRPYPGQRYRHGWIPVAGFMPKSPRGAAEDIVEDVPDPDQSARSVNLRPHDSDCNLRVRGYVPGDRSYANGDCQRFAHATQVITGWPVAQFEGDGSHITTVAPDGRHFDTHGLREAGVIAAEWRADGPEVAGNIDELGWLGTDYCVCDLRSVRDRLHVAGLLTDDLAESADWEIDKYVD